MKYTHPKNYKVKSIIEQYELLKKTFDLKADLEELPGGIAEDCEGVFVIPHWNLIAPNYNDAVKIVMKKLKETRECYDWRNENWGAEYMRQLPIKESWWITKSGVVLLSAQFGLHHAGESVQQVRSALKTNELPLGIYETGIMLLTHPQRLQVSSDLWIDCPGDEYSWGALGAFSKAPCFGFHGKLRFGTRDVSGVLDYFGSASGFVPQSLDTRSLDTYESLTLAIETVKSAGYKVIKEY